MTDTSDLSLITFKAISNFTNDLANVFESKHRPLKLYVHLINKTTLADDKPIQKHIEGFRHFCIKNRDMIVNKSDSNLEENRIVYSDKVFIDMNAIFKLSDSETKKVIWNHILTISALVDPTSRAKEILKKEKENNNSGKEADFLSDIISKVEENVDVNSSNPMEAISSVMNSGIFNDLVSGMSNGLENGELDLGKLMGTVQNMMTKLGGTDDLNNGQTDQAMNMINNMMGSINAGATGNVQNTPDMANLIGPMMNTMFNGNMNNSSISIEDNINKQLEKKTNM